MANIAMLKRLITLFRSDPLRLHMNYWMESCRHDDYYPKCGTIGCIAGWTVMLDYTDRHPEVPIPAIEGLLAKEFQDRTTAGMARDILE